MITAVDLDALLCNLTVEQAGAIVRSAPPGFVDQLGAASRDACAITEALLDTPEGWRGFPSDGVDEWLRLGALDALIKWVSGVGSTCLHAPDPWRPQPVWACAWKPGLVVCLDCLPLLRAPRAVDAVCDGCGHVCAGVEHGDGIRVVALGVAGLMFKAGVCNDCTPAATVAA